MLTTGQARAPRVSSRLMASVLALAVISGLGFLALCVFILWDGQKDARHQAEASASNLLRAIEQDIARTIELYDVSLTGVRENLKIPELASLSPKLRNYVLFDRAADASYFNATFVADENGDIRYDSKSPVARKGNLADREYFKVHRDSPNVGLFISAPFRSSYGNGDWLIALSRRVDKPDGSFGGVVAGALSVDYFNYVFQQFALGKDSRISLHHANGELIMNLPFHLTGIGKVPPNYPAFLRDPTQREGQYVEAGSNDTVARSVSYRRVRNLPMIASIGLAMSEIYASWRSKAVPLAAAMFALGAVILLLAVLLSRELQSRKRAELAVRESESRYRLLSENSNDAIVLRGLDRRRIYASPAFYRLIGYTPEEFGDRQLGELMDEDTEHAPTESLSRVVQGEESIVMLLHVRRGDGRWIWIESVSCPARDETGKISGVIANMRDVTRRKLLEEELAANAAKLAVAALKDGLTGLDNRRSFDERIDGKWRAANRNGSPLSLLMIDVDHFKKYNDEYGHVQGDEALRRVADCITASLRRGNDFGARYGGEEFAVLLPETGLLGAYHVAETIRGAVQAANIRHSGSLFGCITISIGVASIDPADGTPHASLVLTADAALYRAKLNGRNTTERAYPDLEASAA